MGSCWNDNPAPFPRFWAYRNPAVDREKCNHFPPLCGWIWPIARLLRSLGRKLVYRVDAVIDANLIPSILTPACGHPGCRLRPRWYITAAAGVGMWLRGSMARRSWAIGDLPAERKVYFRGLRPIRTYLFLSLFSLILRIWACGAFHCSTFCFSHSITPFSSLHR